MIPIEEMTPAELRALQHALDLAVAALSADERRHGGGLTAAIEKDEDVFLVTLQVPVIAAEEPVAGGAA